jgi:hypothetical protein
MKFSHPERAPVSLPLGKNEGKQWMENFANCCSTSWLDGRFLRRITK